MKELSGINGDSSIIDEKAVTIVFDDDGTGKYNDSAFTYELNTPQSGSLILTFENDEIRVFQVISITENTLRVKDKSNKNDKVIVFKKKDDF